MMLLLIIVVVGIVLFYGSYSISYSFYLRSLCRGSISSGSVAITFDDGVDYVMTPKVLNVLREYGAKATFFIIGRKAELFPEIVRQIVEEGHSIGNHSHSHHPAFPLKSTAEMCEEITACNQAIKAACGVDVTLFRPPFGVTNPMVGKAVRRSGMTSIGWNIRSFDTMKGGRVRILNRISRKLTGGSVVLLHDNLDGADLLLAEVLKSLQTKGLQAVTVHELFGLKHS